uniref:UDP-glucuronosyltransferase n=1 Tax=Nyssomyia neivai TaxID=330878 RepID=A0A1L8E195_9DIPT
MKFSSILIFALCLQYTYGYNILGVFHTSAKSHYILGSTLMKGLAAAGHNVTIVAAHKQTQPVKNMREILISMPPADSFSKQLYQMVGKSVYELIKDTFAFGTLFTEDTLSDPNMRKLMKSGEKFDIVILELFFSESLLGLGKVFDAHMIGFSSIGAARQTIDLNGSPSPSSYVPHFQLSYTDKMNFYERLANTMLTTYENIFGHIYYDEEQEAIYNKHFSDPKPTLKDLKKSSMPVIFLNSHFSVGYPRPNLPNFIEIGGFHINKNSKPLPDDIKNFMETAPNGIIYFSMGSNLKSADLPLETRNALLRVFRQLPVKVMWKWEKDTLPDQPENVLVRKWFPQDDILAHPKVRLFITHGGILSTMEAIYHGVPVLGIPIFGDQAMNMAKAETAGYGKVLKFTNLTEDSVLLAINEMLTNDKYVTRARLISSRFRDQTEDPMSRAIYWVEYVARHKGAKHLVSGRQELNFIQYHNLDILALIFLIILTFTISVIWLLKKIFIKKKQNVSFTKKFK